MAFSEQIICYIKKLNIYIHQADSEIMEHHCIIFETLKLEYWWLNIDGLVYDCSKFIAYALELLKILHLAIDI